MDLFDFCCCCFCCLILLFVLTHFLNNDRSHQFIASCLLYWIICFRGYLFVHTPFFGNYLNFWGFLSVPHLVDNYAEIEDERGRNLVCNRTLPSLLVCFCNSLYVRFLSIFFCMFHYQSDQGCCPTTMESEKSGRKKHKSLCKTVLASRN